MANDLNGKALEIVQERQDNYNQMTMEGTAIPDTFQFNILKPSKNERRVKWSYKVNTPDGIKLMLGQQETMTF